MEIEATYSKGVLIPDQPLPLKENERVELTVQPQKGWAKSTYGLLGWKSDPKIVEQVALDPEFGIEECYEPS